MKDISEIKVSLVKLKDVPLPETIYKYRSWDNKFHKRFILKREVFLASPRTFEDQYDCNNPTRFDLLTNKQIFDYYLWSSKNDNPEFIRAQHRQFAKEWAKNSLVKNKEYTRRYMEHAMQDYFDREGVLSLTENWNNDLMWEKYADSGRGICIGYNTRVMFDYLGGGGEVHYVDQLPIIMPEPFMSSEEASMKRVYFKLKHWEFEEEYRTKKFWPRIATISDRQIELPATAFNKIILGDNISKEQAEEITESVLKNIGNIPIIKRQDI